MGEPARRRGRTRRALFARTAALGLSAWALALVFAPSAGFGAGSGIVAEEAAEGLTCQCGCGLTVANCNHPNCSFAVPAREKIAAMAARGMSAAAIIEEFRKIYGEKVLSAPTTQGFNLLAWITPFAAMGGGLLALLAAARRWRTAHADESAPVGDSSGGKPPWAAALRRELEREVGENL